MLDFLKRFGLGILYVIAAPFLIAFILLWLIYALVIFFIEIIKGFINFFKGKNFFTEFEEDIKAKQVLAERSPSQIIASNQPITTPIEDNKNVQ